MPTGFEAYARLTPAVYSHSSDRYYRWREVAESTGRVAHPLMEWHLISTPAPGSGRSRWSSEAGATENPMVPSDDEYRALIAVLRQFTQHPELCWFCEWTGWSDLEDRTASARIAHDNREYFLSSGPIEAAASFGFDEGPNLWWPDDRAWCVATEIDLAGTYIGASSSCVDALLASDDLEVYLVAVTDRVDIDADVVNER